MMFSDAEMRSEMKRKADALRWGDYSAVTRRPEEVNRRSGDLRRQLDDATWLERFDDEMQRQRDEYERLLSDDTATNKSAKSPRPVQDSLFFVLPQELRDQIYGYVLIQDEPIKFGWSSFITTRFQPGEGIKEPREVVKFGSTKPRRRAMYISALPQVCLQIHEEVMPILHSKNTFSFGKKSNRSAMALAFLMTRPPVAFNALRSLDIPLKLVTFKKSTELSEYPTADLLASVLQVATNLVSLCLSIELLANEDHGVEDHKYLQRLRKSRPVQELKLKVWMKDSLRSPTFMPGSTAHILRHDMLANAAQLNTKHIVISSDEGNAVLAFCHDNAKGEQLANPECYVENHCRDLWNPGPLFVFD